MNKLKEITPITKRIPADRQGAKRHYGVHPYFTRRPYNVVRDYVRHYSQAGDVVMDPFGGSGVTAIEAFIDGRVGIQNDINPLANFIASGIAALAGGEIPSYLNGLLEIEQAERTNVQALATMSDDNVNRLLATLPLPTNVRLPRSADVEYYRELFTERQLAALAILKRAIDRISDARVRNAMLLAWSATLSKLNKTFISAEGRAESRGGSSIFSIYRMKIAKRPIELPPWETFVERAENVIAAKVEIDAELESRENAASAIKSKGDFVVENLDVEELANKYAGKVDYIFTDPPYGGHISYLDLSMLWNCWLGDLPSPEIRQKEIIVGGDLNLTEDLYIARLGKSIECSLRMLKEHAWLSVVFQHWDIRYFAAILNSAAGAGGKLAAAVSQIGDPIWSMHKKKGSDSVLAGEVIITFQKRSNQPEISTPKTHFDLESEVVRLLADAKGDRVYGETIFNELVMGAWRAKRLDELSIDKFALSQLIASKGYAYDATSHAWVTSQPEPAKLF